MPNAMLLQVMPALIRGVVDDVLQAATKHKIDVVDPMPAISRLWDRYNALCHALTRSSTKNSDVGEIDARVAHFVRYVNSVFPDYKGPRDAGKNWSSMKVHDTMFHFSTSIILYGCVQVLSLMYTYVQHRYVIQCQHTPRVLTFTPRAAEHQLRDGGGLSCGVYPNAGLFDQPTRGLAKTSARRTEQCVHW
jgi:hypothetical protein